MNKQELRKHLKKIRKEISIIERQTLAEQAAEILTSSKIFQESEHIGGYLAQPDEFDCMPILEKIQQAKKQCYLPILANENKLEFVAFQPDDQLQPNRYGILEPINKIKIPIYKLDLVILPLVGFDSAFNRLGTGGGYYDRTFSFMFSIKNQHPLLLGLAYECQQINNLPSEPWDVPLAGVLTERRLSFAIDHSIEKRN